MRLREAEVMEAGRREAGDGRREAGDERGEEGDERWEMGGA
jgi:hypothetical protein